MSCFLLFCYFLLYPGMVTVSCSCSFMFAAPGAAICQLYGGGGYYKKVKRKLQTSAKNRKKNIIYTWIYVYIYINICTYVYAPKYQVQRVRLGVVTTLFLCLASYFFLPSPSLSRYGDSILFVFLRLCSTRSCYMPTPWGVGCTINILRKLQTTIAKKNKKKSSQNHFNII